MKNILRGCCLFLISLLIYSCSANKEKKTGEVPAPAETAKPETDTVKIKLKQAIEKMAVADLKAGGFTLEYLLVENLDYKTASLKEYYLYRKEQLEKSREEYRKLTQRLRQSNTPVDMNRYRDDSLKSNKAAAELSELINIADTNMTLYRVTYHLNAKTNSARYNNDFLKFLFMHDLTEVKLRFGNTP